MKFVSRILEEDGKFDSMFSPQSPRQNVEKNADVVHIKLMRNNTFITVTDSEGNTKLKASADRLEELKGGPKLSRYAAEATAEYVGRESRKLGRKSVIMRVKGFTYFKKKKNAIMSLKEGFTDSGGGQHPIVYIEDTTRRPHNGCRLPKSMTSTNSTVSCKVDIYTNFGLITYAENVFCLIPEKNLVTYTTMILGYGQQGMGNSALSLFHSTHESGIKPDAVTLVAFLSACCYTGFADEGLRIFKSMEEVYNIRPTIEHYCCVADTLGRVCRVFKAYDFVKGLGEEGNAPPEIWGSLLGACKNHGDFELGKIVADNLLKMEGKNERTEHRVMLSNIYAEEVSWEDVDRVRNEMKERGLRKEMGCSWIDIAGSRSQFVLKD